MLLHMAGTVVQSCDLPVLGRYCESARRAGPIGNCLACGAAHEAQLKAAHCSSQVLPARASSHVLKMCSAAGGSQSPRGQDIDAFCAGKPVTPASSSNCSDRAVYPVFAKPSTTLPRITAGMKA